MPPKSPVAYVVAETEVPIRHSRTRTRLEAVDLLRGLLMILMVLHHTRIYFSQVRFNPTDPLLSWPATMIWSATASSTARTADAF